MFETTEFFASFSVDDLSVAKRFYGDTLGLDVWETDVGPEWLRGAVVAAVRQAPGDDLSETGPHASDVYGSEFPGQ